MLVHHSVKRRKACSACIKAKRRCDLRIPICARCSARKVPCQYDTSGGIRQTSTQVPKERQQGPAVKPNSPTVSLPGATQQVDTLTASLFYRFASPVSPYSYHFPQMGIMRKGQLDYCITEFRRSITTLVEQNQNPFMHSSLYQDALPAAYQDLLGVSALYSQKTTENQGIVFRVVDDRVAALVASSNAPLWPLEDQLLAVQALLIYQIIRLFDSDIRQRANAERDFMHLEEWTSRLHATYSSAASAARLAWESPYRQWALFESIRRTVIISTVLQAAYAFIRDGICFLVSFLAELPMSNNAAALWKLDEDEWWQAVVLEEGSLLSYEQFVGEWNQGRVVHVGAFEKIMLVACRHARNTLALLES